MTRLARLLVLLPDAMLSDIDLYRRYAPDMPPRAEAIRRLIGRGLDAIARDDWTLHQHEARAREHEREDEMSALKMAVEEYLALPADDETGRARLFEAIEEWIVAEFEAEPDMTEAKLAQIDVTAMAHAYIDRARY